MIFNSIENIISLTKKYDVIYADPPWKFTGLGSKGIRSGAMRKDKPYLHNNLKLENKYPTLSVDEIKQFPIKKITTDNCLLFLWTTDAHLPFAIEIIKEWGFTYATIAFVWNKKTVTGKQVCYYGYWTMKGTEICLLGRRGKVKPEIHNVRQLIECKRGMHSEKPIEAIERIDKLIGKNKNKIELFARREYGDWDCFGNEIIALNKNE